MVVNAPSLANIDLLEFGEKVQELYEAGIRFFHIDIMDGHYVSNLCFPTTVVQSLRQKYPDVELEVHLMVSDPRSYISQLKEYGADRVAFHMDATSFSRRLLTEIKEAGMKAGVVINPSQPIGNLSPLQDYLDYVVFMSVEPGFAGQKFLPGSMERLRELARLRQDSGHGFDIIVDGGVNYDIAEDVVRSGADIIVTNIYMVFNQPEGIAGACQRFRETLGAVKRDSVL